MLESGKLLSIRSTKCLLAEPENVEFLQKLDQVRKLERVQQIQDLKTNADNLIKDEKYDQVIALWNEALTWDTWKPSGYIEKDRSGYPGPKIG